MLRNKWQYPEKGGTALQQPREATIPTRQRHHAQVHLMVPITFMAGSVLVLGLDSGRFHEPFLRLTTGLLVGAFGSGYNLASSIFPPRTLKPHEQFGIAMALSFAVIVFFVLLMSALHIKVSAPTLSAPVAGITLLSGIVAVLRNLNAKAKSDERPRQSLSGALAIGLTVFASLATFAVVYPTITRKTPAFFITNFTNEQTGYPSTVIIHSRHLFRLHISHAVKGERFRLVVRENSHVYRRQTILCTGGHWAETLRLPTGSRGPMKLTASLYDVQNTPFRQLWIFYRVVSKPGPNPSRPTTN